MARSAPEADRRTDEDLFRLVRLRQDDVAFEALVHRYERELYAYLRRYLGDAELAEDVFQATFFRIHQKRDHFIDGHRFRPWLYTVATHQAIDARRRNQRHRMASLDRRAGSEHDAGSLAETIAGRERPSADRVQDAETTVWLLRAVAALPEPLRSTLDLVYRQGLKQREAAARLGIPVGTVKSRISTALQRLHSAAVRSARPVPIAVGRAVT